jgi:transposase
VTHYVSQLLSTHHTAADAKSRYGELEERLAKEQAKSARLQGEVDKLREAFLRQREELELLKRRIFVAKAERIDSKQLELEFAGKLADLNKLKALFPGEPDLVAEVSLDGAAASAPPASPKGDRKTNHKSKGRRNLADSGLPERRIELLDPELEALVKEGKATRIGHELSFRLGWERGGHRKVVIARATYKVEELDGTSAITKTPMPPATFPRLMVTPAKLANVVYQKYGMGLPFFRLESECGRLGVPIDRGSLSRWAEELGATLGATVVEAARQEAMANAFCIATDATGIAVLPPPHEDGRRQACKKAHFFVQIADRDHVFFEYTERETSAAVAEMFKGFEGYIQADAKSVFDILYRPPPGADDDAEPLVKEVGCLAHCRRRFWEAAIALKSPLAREGLYRLRRIYQLDAQWKLLSHEERHRERNLHLRPELEAFFSWASSCYETEKSRRGLLRAAFGYAHRHQIALMRFLDDGRLRIDNNESERNIKLVALGRKAWLFVGSDDHGSATAHILSMIASARLHNLDPEQYLRDVIRVLGQWPRERYLELCPRYWAQTRARLNNTQLAAEYGPLDIPPALPAEKQQISR